MEGELFAVKLGEFEEGAKFSYDMVAEGGVGNEFEVLAAVGPILVACLFVGFELLNR